MKKYKVIIECGDDDLGSARMEIVDPEFLGGAVASALLGLRHHIGGFWTEVASMVDIMGDVWGNEKVYKDDILEDLVTDFIVASRSVVNRWREVNKE